MLHLHDFHHVQVNGLPWFSDCQDRIYHSLQHRGGKHPKMIISLPKCKFTSFHTSNYSPSTSTAGSLHPQSRGDRDTHLCQDVSKLSVHLSPEGCPGNIDEGLPVHLLGHFDLIQNLKCFFLGNLKAFCYYSRVQTLRQGKRNHWTVEGKMVLFPQTEPVVSTFQGMVKHREYATQAMCSVLLNTYKRNANPSNAEEKHRLI